MKLYHELRRRRVFRMTAVYVIASWVILQVADLMFPALGIDEIALRYVWLAVVLGFPLAVLFSWRYDIGANGITRTPPADDVEPDTLSLKPADYVVLLALLGVGAITVFTMTQQVIEEQATLDVAPATRDIDPHSVAVLPLENLSPESTANYFVNGMHTTLIDNLSKINDLMVTSRTSARRVNTSLGLPQVGRQLGVAHIIEGSVMREGNMVRISVNLIEAASDLHVWSETYERPFDDVMAIQNSVARTVARIVEAQLSSEDEAQLARSLEIRPGTFEAYLRAMAQFHKETQEGYQRGIEILEEVLDDDPTSALAYAAVGQGYLELQHSVLPMTAAVDRAGAAAAKALELDPTLPEANLTMALYLFYFENRYEEAKQHVRKAIELNPSFADAWYHLAWFLEMEGEDEEAIAAGEKTVELSPLNDFYVGWLAEQYRDAREYSRALELAESVLALSPNHPVALFALGNTYLEMGRYEDALSAHQKIAHLPFWSYAFGSTAALAGQPEKTREVIARFEPRVENSMPLILMYASMGEADEAIYWMEQARDARIAWYLALFGWFQGSRTLHEDPRFVALAEDAGLPVIPFPRN
jgi:TolB-like protein/cytochrome c-type biogenesis protein CcmH/NrfG